MTDYFMSGARGVFDKFEDDIDNIFKSEKEVVVKIIMGHINIFCT